MAWFGSQLYTVIRGTRMGWLRAMASRMWLRAQAPFLRFRWGTWPLVRSWMGTQLRNISTFLTGFKVGQWFGAVYNKLAPVTVALGVANTLVNVGIKLFLLFSKKGRRQIQQQGIGGAYYGGMLNG